MRLKDFGEFINLINDFKTSSVLTDNILERLAKSFDGLTASEILAKVETFDLTEAQKLELIELCATDAQNYKNVTSTNALSASQEVATASTTGLSNAMKGLGASIKGLAKAHPAIFAVTAAVATVAGVSAVILKIMDANTTSMQELREQADKAREESEKAQTELEDVQSKLDDTKSRIDELNSKGSLSLVEQSELDKLKQTNEDLERQLRTLKDIANQKKMDSADATEEQLTATAIVRDGQEGDSIDAVQWRTETLQEYQKDLEQLQAEKQKMKEQFASLGLDENSSDEDWYNAQDILKSLGIGKIEWDDINKQIDETERQISNLESTQLFAVSNLEELMKKDFYDTDGNILSGKENIVQRIKDSIDKWFLYYDDESIKKRLSDTLLKMEVPEDTVLEIVNNLSDDELSKVAKLDITPFLDEEVTLESVKKAIEKAQEYANANAIQQSVEFDDPSSFLEEIDNKKTKTATLTYLQSEADLLSTIQKELKENGKISTSSMQSIIKLYPEAKEALADYMSGVISEQELFAELEKVYENDTDQYIKSLIEKNEKDEEFFNAVKTNNETLFNELGTIYGYDVDNWKNLAQAKSDIDSQLIEQLSGKWAEYFNVIADASSGMLSMGFDDSELALVNPAEAERLNKQYEETKAWAQQLVDSAHKAYSELENAAYDQIKIGIDTSWETLADDSDKKSKESKESNSKTYDLIERKIEKLNRVINNLENTVDDTFSTWSERNSALADEIDSVAEKINLQEQAYNKYMELADSVELDDYYKDLIKNGAINVITVEDENLQKQIDAFQDYYDKAQDCNDEIRDLNNNLKELQKTKFDNIISQFEDLKSSFSHTVTMIDKYINLSEEHGYFVSLDLYEKQIETYNKDLSMLYSERDSLNNKLQESVNNGLVEEGSEAWYDMKEQINGVNEEIIDTVLNIQKIRSAILELDFSKFDRIQDSISDLTSEADFYVNLIEKLGNDLYDEDGNITNDGLTVQGLHAQNYETYLKQADYYAKKIAEIEAELANDPANTTLLDKKKEYIEVQRESILSAQDEKNAMIDLIKEGYDKQINALSELIQKKKDALSAEKDLHDYQKSIQEKSDNVTNLKKQLKAYENDASEETMSKIQELTVSLKEAEDDLAESEYDKYIEDQEKLLDDLQTEYEEMINERIDNIDKELGDITNAVNGSADIISNTLESLSQDTELPLTKAMSDIWTNATPIMDLDTTVSGIGTTVSGTTSAINNLVTSINDLISKMETEMKKEIESIDDGSYTNSDNNIPFIPADDIPSDNTDYSSNNDSYDDLYNELNNSPDDSGNEDVFIYKYYYPQELNTETSVVDRLKANNIDASFDRRSDYWDALFGDGEYTGSYDQNVRFLDWLKEHGYASGTRSATKGLHLFDENGLGSEVILTKDGVLKQFEGGENVFDAQSTKNLWNLAQIDPSRLIPNLNLNTNIPDFVNRNVSQSVDVGGVNINLPNVKNYPEFKNELMRDKNFTNFMSEKLLGQALGHNELAANKYLR